MEMKMGMHTKMQQRLVMTPRLQQALKLLQMPTLELQQVLKQEILQNPLLEEEEELKEMEEKEKEEENEEEEEEDTDWEDVFETAFGMGGTGSEEREEKEEMLERVPVARQSFSDHLLSQLRLATDDDFILEVGEYIIGNLDESGYLPLEISDIARTFSAEENRVKEVLDLIQTFDPAGVGARNLQECLLLQLERKEMKDSRAAEILRDYFEEFKQKRYNNISKKMKISLQEVQAQSEIIGRLDPKPGLNVAADNPKYVIPDLIVDRVGDKFVISLNEKNVPRLRISKAYRDELRNNPKISDKTKDFIKDKLKNAKWLIQTIEQRRRTMIKVMNSIVDKQREFFEKGVIALKPLTLQQVASEIDMHESTVSRVTTNKYVQTPRGVYELKFFFSAKLSTKSGAEVSSRSAKVRIKEIIEKENEKKPLSDQKIANILKDEGLVIARRTVAKYREQLGILPARHRKVF
ncbi:MAG: RNA polymerase factor sigma-54 [Candidatus Latescibacteria bacterium]|nr:RNA polymerase factor sigma-54 [bacterium]MBD3424995.1 RNA polymerase factor sigma-54 [Candidatus Latescibacterota bacterium]